MSQMLWYLVLVVANLFAVGTQAHAPTRKLSFTGVQIVPQGSSLELAPPQLLIARDGMKTDHTFTLRPDKSITWDNMGWCLEAADGVARVNHCTGEPTQKWDLVPNGVGRAKIQLSQTDRCLNVPGKGGNLELSDCDRDATESWQFLDLDSKAVRVSSLRPGRALAPSVRVAMLFLLLLASTLGLSAWVWRWQKNLRKVLFQGHGSVTRDCGGVALTAPLALDEGRDHCIHSCGTLASEMVPAMMILSSRSTLELENPMFVVRKSGVAPPESPLERLNRGKGKGKGKGKFDPGSFQPATRLAPGSFQPATRPAPGSFQPGVRSFQPGVRRAPGSFQPGVRQAPGSFQPGVRQAPGSFQPGVRQAPGSFQPGRLSQKGEGKGKEKGAGQEFEDDDEAKAKGGGANKEAVVAPEEEESEESLSRKRALKLGLQELGKNWQRQRRKDAVYNDQEIALLRVANFAKRGRKGKGKGKGKPFRKMLREPVEPKGPPQVTLGDSISVADLAAALDVGVGTVIKDLMKMGVLATIQQSIDAETAEKIALQNGGEVTREGSGDNVELNALGTVETETEETSDFITRPPVVTIMGHVDHGKTSLLDALRSTIVAEGEAGGITQSLGAYRVQVPNREEILTFVDTPGHAAFNAMRSRGASITDIVILVVAADDGVMPQTLQSIDAAKSADVPIVVAFTKTDKNGANVQKCKMELVEKEVLLEEFGGDVLSAEVSAKTGSGLDELCDQVLLQAELLDLKWDPSRACSGTVLEARKDIRTGSIATVLIQSGTLEVGDICVAGVHSGRVRSMMDDTGAFVEEATPSTPVELTGLSGVPEAGDTFSVAPDEKMARTVAENRMALKKERENMEKFLGSSGEAVRSFKLRVGEELPVTVLDFLIKADVQGSAEALSAAIEQQTAADDKVQIKTRVIRSTAGPVTKEDIKLAAVSNATILSFNAIVPAQVQLEADDFGLEIMQSKIVYNFLDEIEARMKKLIRPPPSVTLGTISGSGNVLQIFKVSKTLGGSVAGCKLDDGYARSDSNIRILRGNDVVYEGAMKSLRYIKDIVEEVEAPSDCGMSFVNYTGMVAGDRVEAYDPFEDDL